MSGFFIAIYHKFLQYKYLLIGVILLLFLFIFIFSSRILLKEDVSAIIPEDNRIKEINEFLDKFKSADQLILNFYIPEEELSNTDSIIEFARKIITHVSADTQFVKEIQFEVPEQLFTKTYNFFYNHLPLYMEPADYDSLRKKLNPEAVEAIMLRNFKTLISPTGIATKKYIFQDPFSIVPPILKKLENFRLDDNFHIYNSYIFTQDNQHLIAFVQPRYSSKNTQENTKFIDDLNLLLDAKMEQSIVNVDLYGGTAVAVANAKRIKYDIMLTVSLASILMLIFIYMVFRSLRTYFLMFLPVVLGAGFSLALISIVQGEISAIALGIGAVLLGTSIDYSLHLFSHFRNKNTPEHNLRDITEPIIMSCLTTASAFLCLIIVRSEALRELGIFAAISMAASAFFVLALLPIILSKRKSKPELQSLNKTFLDKVAEFPFHQKKFLLLAILVLSIVFYVFSKKVGFNSDIASLNYLSPKLKLAEENLKGISSESLGAVYLITSGKDLDEALEKMEKQDIILNKNKELYSIRSSATDLLLSQSLQKQKIDQWNAFWKEQNKDSLILLMQEKGLKTQFTTAAFDKFYNLLNTNFEPSNPEEFDMLRNLFLKSHISEGDGTSSVITMIKAEEENKALIHNLFSESEDLTVFNQQYFTNQFFKLLSEDFKLLVSASMILVFFIIWIFFGRIELAVFTFIPILLSWVWVLGIMGIFGIQFNIFNIIVSTFIFGLGIDYCIFISKGILNNYKHGKGSLTPYKLSILLSSITTILGVGVFIFAKHPALKSIALVSIIGIVSVVLIATTILPFLINHLLYKKGVKRIRPLTALDFIFSLHMLLVFLSGTLVGTILTPLFYILPFPEYKKKYAFHFFIQHFFLFTRLNGFRIRYKNIGYEKLNFSKPSVIISNHQSYLDLAVYLWMHPQIIALTNEWVWNSRFFGMAIRFADYYPSFKGVDHDLEKLKEKVKQGYSILIFPEGTRSLDGEINRFHQGAFLLAEQLGLEIQPMMVHGANHIMPKKEFFLHPGQISTKIFDRLKVERKDGEISYHRLAKETTAFYRAELDKLKEKTETPSYFRRILIARYIYMGPVLEWYLRVKLKLENNYTLFNELIPKKCRIVDIGCGYGFLVHMLGMISKDRQILGLDYDEEKIQVAKHVDPLQTNRHFAHADVISYDFPESDVFLINDVLHYMPLDKQRSILERCFSKLIPGGQIIIRDADGDLKKRTRGTKITEFFSIRFFKFNKKEYELTYTSGREIEKIALENGFACRRIDLSKRTSNIIFVLSKKAHDKV